MRSDNIRRALLHFLLTPPPNLHSRRRALRIGEVFRPCVSRWWLGYACGCDGGGATRKLNKKLYNHPVLREIKAREE